MPKQVENGKAFEYALAENYYKYLKENRHLAVELVEDKNYLHAKKCYEIQSDDQKQGFDLAALKTIETMLVIEPGLISEKDAQDILKIHIVSDKEGQLGDVRDIVFQRLETHPTWEIGLSAKKQP